MARTPSDGASSARSATKRLLKELEKWRVEQVEERGIERLGPVGEEDLFVWEAVVNGQGVGCGYDGTFFSLSTCFHNTMSVYLEEVH